MTVNIITQHVPIKTILDRYNQIPLYIISQYIVSFMGSILHCNKINKEYRRINSSSYKLEQKYKIHI